MLDEKTKQNLTLLYKRSKRELEKLRIDLTIEGRRLRNLFGAGRRFDGFPDYYRNFFRDEALSLFLMRDADFAKDLLTLASLIQGKSRNPFTGEEPGKIFHEYPGVTIGRKNTLFNAIDTTPLYLILWKEYLDWTNDWVFCEENGLSIYQAITYVIDHMGRSIYWENPANSNAKRFALKATYWRDGGIAGRRDKRLVYPASFTLVQAQAVAAFRSASAIANRCEIGYSPETLEHFANDLLTALVNDFWDSKREAFPIAIDGRGKIFALYSDALHLPFYLKSGDLSQDILDTIFQTASSFETPFGYLTYQEDKKREREFIARKIWPWEAPIIAEAALRHGRNDIAEAAFRVVNGMVQCEHPFSEWFAFNPEDESCTKGGCDIQLWSIAAIAGLWRISRQYQTVL